MAKFGVSASNSSSTDYYFEVPTMMCRTSCKPLLETILKRQTWVTSVEADFPGDPIQGEGYLRVTVNDDDYDAEFIQKFIEAETKGHHRAVEATDPQKKKRYGLK